MIVKFHNRGVGGGNGPVDYLLGKDGLREGATLDRGNPEMIKDLINSSQYAKKYTSGVLSFAEKDLTREQKDQIIDSFETALMAGLDKNQYSILWVEHKDKDRLELNFVIPNIELQTGKRLQPYYDQADRPRVNAWKNITNAEHGLHDPEDPINARTLSTPRDLSQDRQRVSEEITHVLTIRASEGLIRNREEVISTLEDAGFKIARKTLTSISLADPQGGRNIRLKGAIYGQSFGVGAQLQDDIAEASRRYRESAEERLRESRKDLERSIELKRADNQRRYNRTEQPYSRANTNDVGLDRGDDNNRNNRNVEHSMVSITPSSREYAGDSESTTNNRHFDKIRGQNKNHHLHESGQVEIVHSTEHQRPVMGSESRMDSARGLLDQASKYLAIASRNLANIPKFDDEFKKRVRQNVENIKQLNKYHERQEYDDRNRNPVIESINSTTARQRQQTSNVCQSLQKFSGHVQDYSRTELKDQSSIESLGRSINQANNIVNRIDRGNEHAEKMMPARLFGMSK